MLSESTRRAGGAYRRNARAGGRQRWGTRERTACDSQTHHHFIVAAIMMRRRCALRSRNLVEILFPDPHVPRNHLVLREAERHVRIAIANAVECPRDVVVGHVE
jgi:hypothetical protein